MLERFFNPLEKLQRIEATVGGDELKTSNVLHVRPAETAPAPWEPIVDATSLHIQAAARKVGVELPDVRCRIITDPNTDGISGTHFGTLEGTVKKAEKILGKRG